MFYEDLKQEIQELIANNKPHAALKVIDQELAVPYVPRDFELFLHQKRREVQSQIHLERKQTRSLIVMEEIKEMLESNDSAIQLRAIEGFDHINVRLIDRDIEKFLARRDVANDVKSLALIALHRQEIDQDFGVWHDNELIIVNPHQLSVEKLARFNRQVARKLEQFSFHHNQSLTNLALKIALLFLLDYFPQDFHFEVADLAAMALKKAGAMLNEEITWAEIRASFTFNLKVAHELFNHQLPSLD